MSEQETTAERRLFDMEWRNLTDERLAILEKNQAQMKTTQDRTLAVLEQAVVSIAENTILTRQVAEDTAEIRTGTHAARWIWRTGGWLGKATIRIISALNRVLRPILILTTSLIVAAGMLIAIFNHGVVPEWLMRLMQLVSPK